LRTSSGEQPKGEKHYTLHWQRSSMNIDSRVCYKESSHTKLTFLIDVQDRTLCASNIP
jgi:hypothetical protein